nr:MAG TPA: hypothetical protein [Caudoviricetes sp.]
MYKIIPIELKDLDKYGIKFERMQILKNIYAGSKKGEYDYYVFVDKKAMKDKTMIEIEREIDNKLFMKKIQGRD